MNGFKLFSLFLILTATSALADDAKKQSQLPNIKVPTASAGRSPASGTSRDRNDPIEIKGQSRLLNMQLMVQNKKDRLQFVEPRRDYNSEITHTNY